MVKQRPEIPSSSAPRPSVMVFEFNSIELYLFLREREGKVLEFRARPWVGMGGGVSPARSLFPSFLQ